MSFLSSGTIRLGTLATALAALTIMGEPRVAQANVVTFTWDPSQAVPALTSGPAAFTANGSVLNNYIRAVGTNNFTTLKQSSDATQIQTINGFTLNGAPVNVPGLNSSFGLYLEVQSNTQFPINAMGANVGPGVYTKLDTELVADVGHDDGTVLVNAAGIGFTNAAGVANDVVLATGSLLGASLAMNPNGSRNAHYLATFQPVAGETGFFQGGAQGLDLETFLSTAASAFQIVPVDATTVLQVVGADGNSVGTAQLVPEPASLLLLIVGLLGVASLRRNGRRLP